LPIANVELPMAVRLRRGFVSAAAAAIDRWPLTHVPHPHLQLAICSL
jgi:hypothetical protein